MFRSLFFPTFRCGGGSMLFSILVTSISDRPEISAALFGGSYQAIKPSNRSLASPRLQRPRFRRGKLGKTRRVSFELGGLDKQECHKGKERNGVAAATETMRWSDLLHEVGNLAAD